MLQARRRRIRRHPDRGAPAAGAHAGGRGEGLHTAGAAGGAIRPTICSSIRCAGSRSPSRAALCCRGRVGDRQPRHFLYGCRELASCRLIPGVWADTSARSASLSYAAAMAQRAFRLIVAHASGPFAGTCRLRSPLLNVPIAGHGSSIAMGRRKGKSVPRVATWRPRRRPGGCSTAGRAAAPRLFLCSARGFWDTGLNPMPRWRMVEDACHGTPSA